MKILELVIMTEIAVLVYLVVTLTPASNIFLF